MGIYYGEDNMKENAVIYMRVSTEKQDEQSQLIACKELCKKHGWEITGVFPDHNKSAFHNVKRPRYEKVLKLVRDHKIQHVVVWALDRWTRRGNKELKNTIEYLNKFGVQLHSVKEYWIEQITSSELSFIKDIVLDILGWIAWQESNRRSERVKDSLNFQNALQKGTVGRPSIPQQVRDRIAELLGQGKTYKQIRDQITYKGRHGKILHVSDPTISQVKKSLLEKG